MGTPVRISKRDEGPMWPIGVIQALVSQNLVINNYSISYFRNSYPYGFLLASPSLARASGVEDVDIPRRRHRRCGVGRNRCAVGQRLDLESCLP